MLKDTDVWGAMFGFMCREFVIGNAFWSGASRFIRRSLRFKNKAAKFLAFVVLLSAVACSELPELAKLMDNPSNDFTAPAYLMGEIETRVSEQAIVSMSTSRVESRSFPSDRPQRAQGFRSSSDLLVLYSILRT